jgi:hypothetical protein
LRGIEHQKEGDKLEFELPLEKMTTEDKLAAMELLWEELCRNPESVPSPSWHEDVLMARDKRVREGKAEFDNFKAAKDRIRKSTE